MRASESTHLYIAREWAPFRDWDRPIWLKVGFASDPDKRMSQLQTGNPRSLEVIYSAEFHKRHLAHLAERRMHEALSGCDRRGEWFYLTVNEAREMARQMFSSFLMELQSGAKGAEG